jgi:glutamate-1-semialdehyde 2,1-aminomutase
MAGDSSKIRHRSRMKSTATSRSTNGFSVARSEALGERARRVIWKGGKESNQHEALRACGLPQYLKRSAGCRIWDVDGNCYIDYLMSWGTVLLGHRNRAVERAVQRQLARGSHFNMSIEQEVSLAERLVGHIPGAELVRFVTTGAEATNAAVRIARAVTGRERIVQYGFHGWHDWCQGAHPAGIPATTLSSVTSFTYNDLAALREHFGTHPNTISCVIMEPVKDELPHEGFLKGIRDLAHEHGALLVFDETKTGFRMALGGAQSYFGVTPDLCTFGKALANGYPLAVVAGRSQVFERAAGAWVSGTYHGWPPSIVAAHATLSVLERRPVVQHVWTLGKRLMEGVNTIMARLGLQARLTGMPPMPQLTSPESERPTIQTLVSEMVKRGYFMHPVRPWFISYAHDASCIDQTLEDLEVAARQMVAS